MFKSKNWAWKVQFDVIGGMKIRKCDFMPNPKKPHVPCVCKKKKEAPGLQCVEICDPQNFALLIFLTCKAGTKFSLNSFFYSLYYLYFLFQTGFPKGAPAWESRTHTWLVSPAAGWRKKKRHLKNKHSEHHIE
jgi:hypothetical protein